ncbi:uncharacterized protein LOC111043981 isoform X2 [Nilaparvata lugens]|nr:uncharacterized protein LOC111043981 isoform X2 [Nilaparvata lugens]XP_039298180.1 uncharacterized protein LOC111043981 isoform X2 [Nilaparvata lugens]
MTEGYINASIAFSSHTESVWEILVHVDAEVESIWILQSMDCSDSVSNQVPPPKGTVQIYFLPVSDNFSHLILKILRQETDVLCKESMHSEVCSNLSYAFLALQSHALHDTLLLTMNITVSMNLTIELMQGMCVVDCSGKPNHCDVAIDRFHWYKDDKNVFKIENRQPGYYCVRVYPENSCMENECCIFGTNATYLSGEKMESHPLQPDITKKPANLIIVLLLMIMAIVLIGCIIRFRSCKNMNGDVECLSAEGNIFIPRSLPSYITLEAQRYSPVLSNSPTLENVEAFLLYSRQSEAFLEKMNDFRKRLEQDRIVVYDMNSAEMEEQINIDSVAWVEKMMNNCNMRYILVEHKEAVIRHTEWIDNTKVANKDLREPHHLDELFLYALTSIHNRFFEEECIAHDYRRLFVINFQDENEMSFKYTNLVPFKRYCINNNGDDTDHYRQLIQDLSVRIRSTESVL